MQSIAEFLAGFNPQYRLAQRKQLVTEHIERAKLQLQAQHHAEQMNFQRQKMQAEQERAELSARAMVESERIRGENERALSFQEFFQSELGKNTDLIHSFFQNEYDNKRDWDNNISAIQKSLFEIEADTIRQKALQKQLHQQEMEKMQMQYFLQMQANQQNHCQNMEMENLKNSYTQQLNQQQFLHRREEMALAHNLQCLAKILDNVIQNKRVTYDGLNNIMMLLISRLLGLNGEMVSDEDIERFVNEAMAQAGAG